MLLLIKDIEIYKFKCEALNEKKMVRQKLKNPCKTFEAKHKCSFCPYSSVDARNLRRHLVTHTGERPHECPHCNKTFTLKHHLRDHIHIHTGEKPFKCDKCDQAFSRKTHLQRHENIHSVNAPYVCIICGKDFRRKPSLKVHERTHLSVTSSPAKNQTVIKSESIQSPNTSGNFAESYNDIQGSFENFNITFDSSKYQRNSGYSLDTEKKHKCVYCLYSSDRLSHLRLHLSIHSGDKPFRCPLCEKTFRLKHHLSYHLKTHPAENPLKCEKCVQVFTKMSLLKRHKMNNH